MRELLPLWPVRSSCLILASCAAPPPAQAAPPADRVRVSGQVEATDVQVVLAGRRVVCSNARSPKATGCRRAPSSRCSTPPTPSWRSPVRAPNARRRTPSSACCRPAAVPRTSAQAEAQVASAQADVAAADADLAAAELDVQRFEQLLAANSGSRKQRDDAVAPAERGAGAGTGRPRARAWRLRRASPACAPGRAARKSTPPRARVDAADAQIATLEKAVGRRDHRRAGQRHRHDDDCRRQAS